MEYRVIQEWKKHWESEQKKEEKNRTAYRK